MSHSLISLNRALHKHQHQQYIRHFSIFKKSIPTTNPRSSSDERETSSSSPFRIHIEEDDKKKNDNDAYNTRSNDKNSQMRIDLAAYLAKSPLIQMNKDIHFSPQIKKKQDVIVKPYQQQQQQQSSLHRHPSSSLKSPSVSPGINRHNDPDTEDVKQQSNVAEIMTTKSATNNTAASPVEYSEFASSYLHEESHSAIAADEHIENNVNTQSNEISEKKQAVLRSTLLWRKKPVPLTSTSTISAPVMTASTAAALPSSSSTSTATVGNNNNIAGASIVTKVLWKKKNQSNSTDIVEDKQETLVNDDKTGSTPVSTMSNNMKSELNVTLANNKSLVVDKTSGQNIFNNFQKIGQIDKKSVQNEKNRPSISFNFDYKPNKQVSPNPAVSLSNIFDLSKGKNNVLTNTNLTGSMKEQSSNNNSSKPDVFGFTTKWKKKDRNHVSIQSKPDVPLSVEKPSVKRVSLLNEDSVTVSAASTTTMLSTTVTTNTTSSTSEGDTAVKKESPEVLKPSVKTPSLFSSSLGLKKVDIIGNTSAITNNTSKILNPTMPLASLSSLLGAANASSSTTSSSVFESNGSNGSSSSSILGKYLNIVRKSSSTPSAVAGTAGDVTAGRSKPSSHPAKKFSVDTAMLEHPGRPSAVMDILGRNIRSVGPASPWPWQRTRPPSSSPTTDNDDNGTTSAEAFASSVQRNAMLGEMSAGILGDAEESESPLGEMNEGERRYLQYQERLKIQKQEFQNKLPEANIHVKYNKNNAANYIGTTTPMLSAAELRKQLAAELSMKYKQSSALQPQRDTIHRAPQSSSSSSGSASHRGTVVKEIVIPASGLTVREVASKCSMKINDVKSKLVELGDDMMMSTDAGGEETVLDADLVELFALEIGLEVKRIDAKRDAGEAMRPSIQEVDQQSIVPRNPVVCVMGHVDHGKTTLLDSLRKASVAATEAGGITQKLSAFAVDVKDRQVVFLDTPGHAAFTAMRSHGAAATDIVILVVAAEDGVRPQTKEAIRIAKDAGCTIIVALNKVDKIPAGSARETARLRVLTELLELELVAESFGGDVQVVEVSGKTGEGLDALVEGVLLQADLLDMKAASQGLAECTVLEASMEKGRGVMCDVLVRWGELCVGDNVVVGTAYGKVKAMTNDRGKAVTKAGPSSPIRLLGLRSVPTAGQELISVSSETKARQIAERREKVQELRKSKQQIDASSSKSGADGDNEVEVSQPIEVNVVLKADGQGTLNALQQIVTSLQSRTTDVNIKIAGASIGYITRTEVEASANMQNAFILGFNIGLTDSVARELAKQLDVTIFRDTIIYRLEDSLVEAMERLMPKEKHFELEGKAKVLQLFNFNTKQGATLVAGVNVYSGVLKSAKPGKTEYVYKIYRNGKVLMDDLSFVELKRFKDVVHEVSQGTECGISFEQFKEFEVNDEIECYRVEWKTKSLVMAEGNSGVLKKDDVTQQQQRRMASMA